MSNALFRVVCQSAKIIYPAEPACLIASLASKIPLSLDEHDSRDHRHHAILRNLIECESRAQKNSTEKRALRALLCGSLTRRDLIAIANESQNFSISPGLFCEGKKDFEKLKLGLSLEKDRRTIQKFVHSDVEEAVSFILSPRFVGYLSWGCKNLYVDGKKCLFPRISRRIPPIRIYEAYDSWCGEEEKRSIGKSSFLKIANELTSDNVKIVRAVDYVTGFLVNDTTRLLQRITCDKIHSEVLREEYARRITMCKHFLKNVYSLHLKHGSTCSTHCIYRGLSSSGPFEEDDYSCDPCKAPFILLEDIKSECCNPPSTLGEVLDEVRDKFYLFMGHRVRVTNQQRAIQGIHEELQKSCPKEINGRTKCAVVVLDFKMKFEASYFREKTVESYGKRGTSWHGAMITCYSWDISCGR